MVAPKLDLMQKSIADIQIINYPCLCCKVNGRIRVPFYSLQVMP